jgi:hypothetical protein
VLVCSTKSEPCHVVNAPHGSDFICTEGINVEVYKQKNGQFFGHFKYLSPEGVVDFDELSSIPLKLSSIPLAVKRNPARLVFEGSGILFNPKDRRLKNRTISHQISLNLQNGTEFAEGDATTRIDCFSGNDPGQCYSGENFLDQNKYGSFSGHTNCQVK